MWSPRLLAPLLLLILGVADCTTDSKINNSDSLPAPTPSLQVVADAEAYFGTVRSRGSDVARHLTVEWLRNHKLVETADVGPDGATIWIHFKSGTEAGLITNPPRDVP